MKKIRIHLAIFVTVLLLSGITAFPVQTEITLLYNYRHCFPNLFEPWIAKLFSDMSSTPAIMFYGTDWLAFAHIIISLFFIPVYIHPTQHKANVIVGMAACPLIFPLAFVCGPIRGIPFFHQLIDCSFGVIGFAYLYFILKKINNLKITDK